MVSRVMGKTLADNILSENSESDARAGDIVIANVGLAFLQDGTDPLALREFPASGLDRVANSKRVILFLDHASPSPSRELSNDHILLRQFASKHDSQRCDIGDGVCHQIITEGKSVACDMKHNGNDPTAVGTSQLADAVIEKIKE